MAITTRSISPPRITASEAQVLSQPGLVCWVRAANLVGVVADGAAVAAARDASRRGFHGGQATVGVRPTFTREWLNGWPAITFDGTQYLQVDRLAAFFTGDDKAVTIYTAAQRTVNTGLEYLWGMGRSSNANPIHGGQIQTFYQLGRRSDSATTKNVTATLAVDAAAHVTTWLFSGTTGEVWVDGVNVAVAADQDVPTLTLDTFTIGALRRTSVANFLTGHIGDLLVYRGAHSTAQREAVEDALMGKYGL